jgi:phospho-N-acetylmuramoyl-pentapeptide-transferase
MELWLLMTFISAFAVMAVVGRPMIAWLKGLRGMKWSAREDTPDTHLQKAGTPSMGGLGILFAATMSFVGVVLTATVLDPVRLSGSPLDGFDYLALSLLPALTLAHMGLGYADDWSKATGRGGLRARAKFLGQLLLAIAFLVAVGWMTANQGNSNIRFYTSGGNGIFHFYALGPVNLALVFALLVVVVVGVCNAVNITDGIDGLAAGLCVQVGLAFWLAGSDAYGIKVLADLWWLALAGACAGFLLFNKYKAQVFMGDTGSLALGAALGGAAVLTRTVFLLPFIGFIFFVELLSVTIQVAYFKYTKKKTGEGQRIFRRAPLHHHFELGGWSEWRVVATFWAVNLLTTAMGLALWSAGILPRFP